MWWRQAVAQGSDKLTGCGSLITVLSAWYRRERERREPWEMGSRDFGDLAGRTRDETRRWRWQKANPLWDETAPWRGSGLRRTWVKSRDGKLICIWLAAHRGDPVAASPHEQQTATAVDIRRCDVHRASTPDPLLRPHLASAPRCMGLPLAVLLPAPSGQRPWSSPCVAQNRPPHHLHETRALGSAPLEIT